MIWLTEEEGQVYLINLETEEGEVIVFRAKEVVIAQMSKEVYMLVDAEHQANIQKLLEENRKPLTRRNRLW